MNKLTRTPVPVIARLSLVALIWGGTFIAGRVAAPQMSAPMSALLRYIIATVALVIIVFMREGGLPRLSRTQWVGVVLLGMTGVAGYNLGFMYGLETVPASRGSLLIALNPAATMIGAAIFLREPLTLAKIVGCVLALLGVAIELSGGNPLVLFEGGAGWGEAALFAAAVSWAGYTLIGKGLIGGMSALAMTTYAALTGTALLALIVAVRGEIALPHATLGAWAALAYMGIFGTAIAFVWFMEGVQAVGPARASIFVNLVPVAAITLGVLLLGEHVNASMIVGAALVIAGVWIINRPVATPPIARTRPT